METKLTDNDWALILPRSNHKKYCFSQNTALIIKYILMIACYIMGYF